MSVLKVSCHCTVEPLGVVLRRPQRRHPPEAAVDDGVAAREINDGGGVQLAALRHHRRGVVAGVVRASRHAVDPLQHAAHVAHLAAQVQKEAVGRCPTISFVVSLCDLTSLVIHSGWKALVPQVMTSVLFTSRTRM